MAASSTSGCDCHASAASTLRRSQRFELLRHSRPPQPAPQQVFSSDSIKRHQHLLVVTSSMGQESSETASTLSQHQLRERRSLNDVFLHQILALAFSASTWVLTSFGSTFVTSDLRCFSNATATSPCTFRQQISSHGSSASSNLSKQCCSSAAQILGRHISIQRLCSTEFATA